MTTGRLFVCATCDRYARPSPDEPSKGRRMVQVVDERIRREGRPVPLRVVECLNGCLHPCNVALRGPGRYTIRFGYLTPEDTADLLDFAERYLASPTGEVPEAGWPAALSDKLTVKSPPLVLAAE